MKLTKVRFLQSVELPQSNEQYLGFTAGAVADKPGDVVTLEEDEKGGVLVTSTKRGSAYAGPGNVRWVHRVAEAKTKSKPATADAS